MDLGTAFQPPPMAPPAVGDLATNTRITGKLLELLRTGKIDKTQKDPYEDEKALLKFFEECKKEALDNRWVHERSWWRNLLYFLGRHWIYYDTSRGQWMDKRLAKWIPRPVTNKIAEVHQTILSLFEAVDLIAKARPTGSRPKDISTSEVADKMEPAIRAEHEMSRIQRCADFWLIAVGNVFLHPWWDKFAEDASTLQTFQTCGICGTNNASADVETSGTCETCDMPMARTADASTISSGKGKTDVCSPWEIAFSPGYSDFHEVPYVIRLRWRTKAWVEKAYPELALKLRFDKSSNERSIQLLRSLAVQSDLSANPLALMAGSGLEQGEGIVEYELWQKPNRTYPKGLMMRVMGDTQPELVEDEGQSLPGPLPYMTPQGDAIWPWIHEPYERIGGRVWGRSPLDSIIQKNDQLNQHDSLVQLIVQRTSNPVWLEPKGAEVKKFTGEPGLVVRYNPLIAGGAAKPERIEGSNVPASLNNLRQQYLSDIEMLAGTPDVLKGAKPAGVEAFSAMQLLVERSQSRFGMVLSERGEGYRLWYQIALELERAFGPDERFFAVIGPNGTWQGTQFKKADLMGSIQIVIEDGSQAPKTNLGKRAAVQQLQQLAVLNPQDPDQTYSILRIFGQQELLPSLDADVKSALQEQDAFERWILSPLSQMVPGPPPTDPMTGAPLMGPMGLPLPGATQPMAPSPMLRKPWHSDVIHMSEHRKWALSDAARQMFAKRPDVEQQYTKHMADHEAAQMATLAGQPKFFQMPPMLAAPPGPPGSPTPPPGAPGVGQALSNSNRESGSPADAGREVAQGTEGVARA
jgi:hypothetical protein